MQLAVLNVKTFRKVLAAATWLGCMATAQGQMNTNEVVCTVVPERGRVCFDNGAPGNDGLPDYNRPGRPSPYPGRPGRPDPRPIPPPSRPVPPPPTRPLPPPNHNPGYSDVIEIPIYRTVQNETINLDYHLRGEALLYSVEVSLRGYYNSSSWLELLIDRQVEDSEYTAYDNYAILTPRRPVSVGHFGRSLQLRVAGSVYIDRIVLNVRDGGYNPPRPPDYGFFDLQTQVGQNFRGTSYLDLFSRLNLYSYRGYRIESVTVYGSSARGFGSVEVRASGYSYGSVTLPTFLDAQTIYLGGNQQIGYNLNSLDLQIQGNIWIERVVVRLSR